MFVPLPPLQGTQASRPPPTPAGPTPESLQDTPTSFLVIAVSSPTGLIIFNLPISHHKDQKIRKFPSGPEFPL